MDAPKTLTEKHQAQSLASWSQGRPPPPDVTPALLKSRWQAPSLAKTSAASDSTDSGEDTSVSTPRTCPGVRQLLERDFQDRLLDVGDDDACPVSQEGLHDAAPDAGRSAGDDGNLAVQIVHTRAPVFLTPRQATTITLGQRVQRLPWRPVQSWRRTVGDGRSGGSDGRRCTVVPVVRTPGGQHAVQHPSASLCLWAFLNA